LGIAHPEASSDCLGCHSDTWSLRAPRAGLDCRVDTSPTDAIPDRVVQLCEGVACEACHGGSERWLVARAELCLSCHFGTSDKSVKHRIMGAGRPRLRFELDTFTRVQPPHFAIDDDYVRRKQSPSPAVIGATSHDEAYRPDELRACLQRVRSTLE